ncbi:MAG: pilus assembly protein N-terminal domain-containing protein [Caulobacterales bacterium]
MRSLTIALILALAPLAASAATMAVAIDQAVRITLPRAAQDVIVGNPAIANVNVIDERHVVVIGKTGGVTNLIIADAAGRSIFNRELVVGMSAGSQVTVFRGGEAANYTCAPGCQRSAMSQADAMTSFFDGMGSLAQSMKSYTGAIGSGATHAGAAAGGGVVSDIPTHP